MRGLGSFLIVAGIISLGMQAVNSNFALFDWMDHWGGSAGILLRAALIATGAVIIAHSFFTGRHD